MRSVRLKILAAVLAVVVLVAAAVAYSHRRDETSLAASLNGGNLAAAETLAAMQSARGGELLADAARSTRAEVSAAAVMAVAKIKNWPKRDQVIVEAAKAPQYQTRQAAAVAIRQITKPRPVRQLEDPRYCQHLRALLKDPNEKVRASAANSLGSLNAFYSTPDLIDALLKEDSPLARSALQRALVSITRYPFEFSADKKALSRELNNYLIEWDYAGKMRKWHVEGQKGPPPPVPPL
ncbi:MAG: HEAT repeat domain-containing protein [Planctomycetaceae bacterium]|nr:HEAT repeat domain-containing protein [Planctomycetaceae bacterium]